MNFNQNEFEWQMSLTGTAKIIEINFRKELFSSKLLVIAVGKVDEISELEFDENNSAYKFFSTAFENIEVSLVILEDDITNKSSIHTFSHKKVFLDDGTEHSFKHLQAKLTLNEKAFNTLIDFSIANEHLKFALHLDGGILFDAYSRSNNLEEIGLSFDLPNFEIRMPKNIA